MGRHDFASAALESAAPVPRVGRVSIHMELWASDSDRPSCLLTLIARMAAGSCSAGCWTLCSLYNCCCRGLYLRFCTTGLILFGFTPVLRFLFVWTRSILYGYLHSGSLPGCILLLYYVSYLLFLGGGGGGASGWWWGGGPVFRLLMVSSGGLPEWGHFSTLGLGLIVPPLSMSGRFCLAICFW